MPYRTIVLLVTAVLLPMLPLCNAQENAAEPQVELPTSVDLRPEFKRLGLTQRQQGGRGTCSVFATVEAVEFAVAKKSGQGIALSVEFANWAANTATGRADDGDFFKNIIAGIRTHGICPESTMPYQSAFSRDTTPSKAAISQAAELKQETPLEFHWLKSWKRTAGLDDADIQQVKTILATGFPVSAGSYHSILFVGYADDAALPGGGKFLIADSNLREHEISYDGAKQRFCDMFWVSVQSAPTETDDATK